MDRSVLLPFRLAVIERHLGVEGVHVYVRGKQPLEHHTTIDIRRDVHSIAKTVTGLAVGIARDEGKLDLDDSVVAHLPEFAADAAPGADRITVRHLLSMTSGNDYRWDDPDAITAATRCARSSPPRCSTRRARSSGTGVRTPTCSGGSSIAATDKTCVTS